MIHVVKLKFPQDGGVWTEVTNLVRYKSVQIDLKLMNEDLKSCVDTYSFSLKYDSTVTGKFYEATSRIFIEVKDQSGAWIFSGAIDPSFEQTEDALSYLSVEAVDMSYPLDEPIAQSFCWPASVGGSPYAICSPLVPTTSIIHQTCGIAGVAVSSSIVSIPSTVESVARKKGETTYRELLDTLLSEYGYVLTMTASGELTVVQWDCDSVVSTVTIDESRLSDVEKPKARRKYVRNDGIELEYARLSTIAGALLYRDSLPVASDGSMEGEAIAPGDYYPPDGDIEDTYQDFSATWLDLPYLTRSTRKKNDDISLVATSDHAVSLIADDQVIEIDSATYEAKRAKILLKNPSTAIKKLYSFEISGNALFRQQIGKITSPSTATNAKQITTEFIFDEAAAARNANARAQMLLDGNLSLTFGSKYSYAPGTIASLGYSKLPVATTVLIINVKWNKDLPNYWYEAVAILDYNALAEYFAERRSGNQGWASSEEAMRNAFDEKVTSLSNTTVNKIADISLADEMRMYDESYVLEITTTFDETTDFIDI